MIGKVEEVMAKKDYYTVLGVDRNATPETIRKAYRQLARKYHPDTSKEQDSGEQFTLINEAYEVLKDPEKRQRYDMFGSDWQQESPSHNGWANTGYGPREARRPFRRYSGFGDNIDLGDSEDLHDIFKRVFDQSQDLDNTHHTMRQDVAEAELTVTIEEILDSSSRTLTIQTMESDGHGRIHPTHRQLNVNLPIGITDGSVIRLAGQGGPDPLTGHARDLLLTIKIARHPLFAIDGYDLHTTVAVSPWEAALGTRIPVTTPRGPVKLTLPPGSQTGKKFRLRAKGLPGRGGKAGDLIAEIEILLPERLTEEEHALLTQLAKRSTFDPRKSTPQRNPNKTDPGLA